MQPPLDQQRISQFEQICKSAGLKVTQQRLEVYCELLESADHPSAETIYRRLAERLPTLSLDTVYRTLATFEKLHLVHRVETTGAQARYEALTSRHHHFLCDDCGKVIDVYWQDFDTIPLPVPAEGIGSIDHASVVMRGVCATCLDRRKKPCS